MTAILAATTQRHASKSRASDDDLVDAELRGTSMCGITRQTYIVTPLSGFFRADVLAHLLALDASERTLRFGHAVRDHAIEAYVASMCFGRGEVFGAHDARLNLVGVGHLVVRGEPDQARHGELGLSVQREARGRGIGSALFQYALHAARAVTARTFSMQYAAENHAMHRIAHRAGMRRHCTYGEVHATLDLAT